MAWLAVDMDGSEFIYSDCPERVFGNQFNPTEGGYICLPTGTIEKMLGYKLTWKDDPVELV